LKPNSDERERKLSYGFDRTYEGLKPHSLTHPIDPPKLPRGVRVPSFDRTYEGLKRECVEGQLLIGTLVLTVPMRV